MKGKKLPAKTASYDTAISPPFEMFVTDLMEVAPGATYLVDRFDSSPSLRACQKGTAESMKDRES